MEKIARCIALRFFQGLFVAFGVSTLTFVLLMAMPGDLAVKVTMARYGEDGLSNERIEMVRTDSGLDRSPLWLYGKWLGHTLSFNLGYSMISGRPVRDVLRFHMGLSFKLAAAAMLISLILALPMGIISGLRPGSRMDLSASAFSSLMVSMPSFVVGAFFILLLAIRFRVFPAAGFQGSAHLVLPATTLGIGLCAISSRVIRTAVVEVKNSFYLLFARIKGLSGIHLALNHGIRNASVPVITFLALQMAHVLDGVVVLENLFNWPGIGFLLLESIQGRDIPMIQAVSLFIGLFYVGANLTADLICAWLDPRVLSQKGDI